MRQTEVLERIALSRRGSRSTCAGHELLEHAEIGGRARDQAFSPPTLSPHFSPSIASSTQSSDGVLIVSPLKIASENLPPDVRRKILGSGHGGE
jgi:hypothetical protein